MSFGPANDAKEQVRQSIDIVDLVGGYIQLRRQGRNYVGICPWHDDSRPSLQRQSAAAVVEVLGLRRRRRRVQLRDEGRRAGVSRGAGAAGREGGRRSAIAGRGERTAAIVGGERQDSDCST